jgi:hypothetical protein
VHQQRNARGGSTVWLVLAAALVGACAPDFNSLLPAADGGVTGACTEASDCPQAGACVDALCDDGLCLFQARQCESSPCTLGTCNVDTDECDFQPRNVGEECEANKACTPDGECECIEGFQDCDGEPGCESHINTDFNNCGACGEGCDGGMSCIGGECDVCTGPEDCDDGRACTEGTCTGGECHQTVVAGHCLISGTCRAEGARRSTNPCQVCDPANDPNGWTTLSVGTNCNDGDFCTTGTTCTSDGTCGGGGATCDDSLECTANQCQTDPNQCLHPLRPGWCLIDGACYGDGEANPDNECQQCNASSNPGGWSSVPDGQTCGGNDDDRDLRCTAGVCGGCRVDGDCDDGDRCTTGHCSDDQRCEFRPISNCCPEGQCFDGVLGRCCTIGSLGCVCSADS